jgi:hypothetical protein
MFDTPSHDAGPVSPRLFRRTLIRVVAVQVATLLLLWLLQTCYTG